ncbi:hypothetical protein [Mesoflavibacter sp. CH_XMU1422-2]|jgi:sulfopyruvate decarboxylase TPP-binding subunit|uniref:hypothetical protein n=1 Tax=Mesoflavibacter sp. CH_XMU1422-2 TaxID=3107770 RepID=UPI00300AD9AB
MSLDVKHYLGIYKTRLEMQNSGITNPTNEIKKLTRTIVEKLSLLPLEEKIELENGKMIDSKGNVIITFPRN